MRKARPLHQMQAFRKHRVSFERITPMHVISQYRAIDRTGAEWRVVCDGSRQYPWRSCRMADGAEWYDASLEDAAYTISQALPAARAAQPEETSDA